MSIQNMCYLEVDGEKIFVFVRWSKLGCSLKQRKADWRWTGTYLEDESIYLSDKPELLEKLKSGNVIKV